MGRRTYGSNGFRLTSNQHSIITCNPDYDPVRVVVFDYVDAALAEVRLAEKTLIIGYGQSFKEMPPHADPLYLTLIKADIEIKSHLASYCSDLYRDICEIAGFPLKSH